MNSRLANAEMGRVLDLAEKETEPITRRLIRYFAHALACRAYGLHLYPNYLSFSSTEPTYLSYEVLISCSFVAVAIKDVIKGKRKVHVIQLIKHVDFYRQWITSFVDSYFGDLMHLRLSFLVQENVGFKFKNEIKEELIRACKFCNIKLEYETIAVNSLADIDVSLLEMRDDEFVVVNCLSVFSKMLSEAGALEKMLLTVRDVIKPNIMIVAERDANHNQSFLLRFDEALKYYSSLFERCLFERCPPFSEGALYHRYSICNIVACEGSNRVERHQTWAQWESLLTRYGFSIFNCSSGFSSSGLGWEVKLENGIFVIRSTETEKQPFFFVSAWATSTSSGSNEGLFTISSESDRLQTFQISPEEKSKKLVKEN